MVARYFRFTRNDRAIAPLDGIRAIAILLVLGRHGARPYWNGEGSLFPIGGWDAGIPLINGWMGVDLFFVLSGFLITHHVCNRYGRRFGRKELPDYITRRVLRIVPLYFAVLVIAAAGLFPLFSPSPGAIGFRVAYHMLFLQDYLPSNIIVVFWSLGVEEKFYLLAPFALMGVFALPRRSWQYIALVAAACLPTLLRWLTSLNHPDVTTYEMFFPVFRSPFHLTFDGLALGALCALVARDGAGPARGSTGAHLLFWSGAVGLAWLLGGESLLDQIDWYDKLFLEAGIAVAASALLLGAVCGGGPAPLLGHWSLLFFSRISYSLYLVHYPMVPLAQWMLGQVANTDGWSPALHCVTFLPIYATLSIGVAVVFHFAIEKPFLVIKDNLPRPGLPKVPQRTLLTTST